MRIENRNFNLFTQAFVEDHAPGDYVPIGIPAIWIDTSSNQVYIFVGIQNELGIWTNITTSSGAVIPTRITGSGSSTGTATAMAGVIRLENQTNSGLAITLGGNLITMNIDDGGIITSKIADQAVTQAKLSTALQTAITNAQTVGAITVNSGTVREVNNSTTIEWDTVGTTSQARLIQGTIAEAFFTGAVRTLLNRQLMFGANAVDSVQPGDNATFSYDASKRALTIGAEFGSEHGAPYRVRYNNQIVDTISAGDNITLTYDSTTEDLQIAGEAGGGTSGGGSTVIRSQISTQAKDLPPAVYSLGRTLSVADSTTPVTSWTRLPSDIYASNEENPLTLTQRIAVFVKEDTAATSGLNLAIDPVTNANTRVITTSTDTHFYSNRHDVNNIFWPGQGSYGTGSSATIDDTSSIPETYRNIYKLSFRILNPAAIPATDTTFIQHGTDTSSPIMTLRRNEDNNVVVSFQTITARAATGATGTASITSTLLNALPIAYNASAAVTFDLPTGFTGDFDATMLRIGAIASQGGNTGAPVFLNGSGFSVTNFTQAVDVNGYEQTFTINGTGYLFDFNMDFAPASGNTPARITIAPGRFSNTNNVSWELFIVRTGTYQNRAPTTYTPVDIATLSEGDEYSIVYAFKEEEAPTPFTSNSNARFAINYNDGSNDIEQTININRAMADFGIPSNDARMFMRRWRIAETLNNAIQGNIAIRGLESYSYTVPTGTNLSPTPLQLAQMYRNRECYFGLFVSRGGFLPSTINITSDVNAPSIILDGTSVVERITSATSKDARIPTVQIDTTTTTIGEISPQSAGASLPADTIFQWYSIGDSSGSKTFGSNVYQLWSDTYDGIGNSQQSSANIATLFDARAFTQTEIAVFGWTGAAARSFNTFKIAGTFNMRNITPSNQPIVGEIWRPNNLMGAVTSATQVLSMDFTTSADTSITVQVGDILIAALRNGQNIQWPRFRFTNPAQITGQAAIPPAELTFSSMENTPTTVVITDPNQTLQIPVLGKIINSGAVNTTNDLRLLNGFARGVDFLYKFFSYRFWLASELGVAGIQYFNGTSFVPIGTQSNGVYMSHFNFTGTFLIRTHLTSDNQSYYPIRMEIIRPTITNNRVTAVTVVNTTAELPAGTSGNPASHLSVQVQRGDCFFLYTNSLRLSALSASLRFGPFINLGRSGTTSSTPTYYNPDPRTNVLPAGLQFNVVTYATTTASTSLIAQKAFDKVPLTILLIATRTRWNVTQLQALPGLDPNTIGTGAYVEELGGFYFTGSLSFSHNARGTNGATTQPITLQIWRPTVLPTTLTGAENLTYTALHTITLQPNSGFSAPIQVRFGDIIKRFFSPTGLPVYPASLRDQEGGYIIRLNSAHGPEFPGPGVSTTAGSASKPITNVSQPLRDITFDFESQRDETVRSSESFTTMHTNTTGTNTFFVPFYINSVKTERNEAQPSTLNAVQSTDDFVVNIRSEFYRRFEQEDGSINIRLITRPTTAATTYTVASATLNWEVRGREQGVTTTSSSQVSALYYCAQVDADIGTALFALEGYGRQTIPAIPSALTAVSATTPTPSSLPTNGIAFISENLDYNSFRSYRVPMGSGNATLFQPITFRDYPTSLNALEPYIDRADGHFTNPGFFVSRPLLVQIRLRSYPGRFTSGTTPSSLPYPSLIFDNPSSVRGIGGTFIQLGTLITQSSSNVFTGHVPIGNPGYNEFEFYIILDRISGTGGLDTNPIFQLTSDGTKASSVAAGRGWTSFPGGEVELQATRRATEDYWIDTTLNLAPLIPSGLYFSTSYVSSTFTSFIHQDSGSTEWTKTYSGTTFGFYGDLSLGTNTPSIPNFSVFYPFRETITSPETLSSSGDRTYSLYIGKHREAVYSNSITFTIMPATGFASMVLIEIYRFQGANPGTSNPGMLGYRRVHVAVLTATNTETSFEVKQGDLVVHSGASNPARFRVSSTNGM